MNRQVLLGISLIATGIGVNLAAIVLAVITRQLVLAIFPILVAFPVMLIGARFLTSGQFKKHMEDITR